MMGIDHAESDVGAGYVKALNPCLENRFTQDSTDSCTPSAVHCRLSNHRYSLRRDDMSWGTITRYVGLNR